LAQPVAHPQLPHLLQGVIVCAWTVSRTAWTRAVVEGIISHRCALQCIIIDLV
jgi:hypothetical protein